ncbi:tetratricopeptide repeat protein [Parvicella tangerina]|uniref:Tetratricopeptide repeat protein n=1 Tax=Parvicella tangerina TaxID=2829795 RepID=A0A916JRD5_9FLAO|nr:tetratricopeptide repeat protein [Parvicella tangerina]CAG5087208.1 hypothetical protein CRYO30217_03416 [Parvicella tangerina]CAG5087223.1 hypothetical protein CRYO30217_03421 [Parvicella tangerina]
MKLIKYIFLFLIVALLASCNSTYYFKKADKQFNLERYGKAIPFYEKGLSKERNIDALQNLAECHVANNRKDEAIPLLEEALTLGEVNPRTFFILGQSYLSEGKYEKSIDFLSKYLERMPNDVVAQMLLASAYSIEDRFRDTTLYTLNSIDISEFETVPRVECSDCYDCSEETHQENRRTEFKVKKK